MGHGSHLYNSHMKRERAIQAQLFAHCSNGEWFIDSADLRAKISGIIASEPPPAPPPAAPPEEHGPFLDFSQRKAVEARSSEIFNRPIRAHRQYWESIRADLIALPREMFRMADEAHELLQLRHLRDVIEFAKLRDDYNAWEATKETQQEVKRTEMFVTNIIVCSKEQARRDALGAA